MKPEVLHLREADDPQELVLRVVERLTRGGLVALPTETVYGVAASAMHAECVTKLRELKDRDESKPLALALGHPGTAVQIVPHMSLLAERFVRRCWPGPVTLVFDHPSEYGVLTQLPAHVKEAVTLHGSVGIRVPSHEFTQQCIERLGCPLVLTSANPSGQPDPVTAQEVMDYLGTGLDMVVDAGTSRYGKSSTVVKISGDQWNVLREGIVPLQSLQRLSRCVILFVCTGNTCRSPMAEGLCKKILAEKLDCEVSELPERGFEVMSAGVSAMPGMMASSQAIQVMKDSGVNINDHLSQPLNLTTAYQADAIFAMTDNHRQMITRLVPQAAERVHLLRRDEGNISDPVGLDTNAYRRCAQDITENLKPIVSDLVS